MTTSYTWNAPNYESDTSDEAFLLKEAASHVRTIRVNAEQWADEPTSPKGVVHLMRAIDYYERFMGVLDSADWYTHRELSRFSKGVQYLRPIEAQFEGGDTTLGFNQGRWVQRSIDYLRRMDEEWTTIAEYAEEQ